jgi:REP element-mobilizing transposase RayT
MKKFKGKYRIPSARLQTWDYGNNGAYFLTLCTHNRETYFGNIEDGNMLLSEMGQIAQKHWNEIPEHFPFVILDEFIVMPNHVHGIIIIDKPDGNQDENGGGDVETRLIASLPVPSPQPLPIQQPSPFPQSTGGITGNHNPMFYENISRIIRWYKGRCTFEMHKIQRNFEWQPLFYDHIIRDDESYRKIKNYIINNPKNWKGDRFCN